MPFHKKRNRTNSNFLSKLFSRVHLQTSSSHANDHTQRLSAEVMALPHTPDIMPRIHRELSESQAQYLGRSNVHYENFAYFVDTIPEPQDENGNSQNLTNEQIINHCRGAVVTEKMELLNATVQQYISIQQEKEKEGEREKVKNAKSELESFFIFIFHFAVIYDAPEAVRTILSLYDNHSQDQDQEDLDHLINLHDGKGYSALHYAAMYDSVEAAQVLLHYYDNNNNNKIIVDIIDQRHKVTPLYVAARNGSWQLVRLLRIEGSASVRFDRKSAQHHHHHRHQQHNNNQSGIPPTDRRTKTDHHDTILDAAVASKSCLTVAAVLEKLDKKTLSQLQQKEQHQEEEKEEKKPNSNLRSVDHVLLSDIQSVILNTDSIEMLVILLSKSHFYHGYYNIESENEKEKENNSNQNSSIHRLPTLINHHNLYRHENVEDHIFIHTELSDREKIQSVLLQRRSDGGNIMHISVAEEGRLETLLFLLSLLPASTAAMLLNEGMDGLFGCTPTMVAVLCNHTLLLRSMSMLREIDVDKQNRDGDTALHIAVRHGYRDAVYLLYHVGGATVSLRNQAQKTVKDLMKEAEMKLEEFDTEHWELENEIENDENDDDEIKDGEQLYEFNNNNNNNNSIKGNGGNARASSDSWGTAGDRSSIGSSSSLASSVSPGEDSATEKKKKDNLVLFEWSSKYELGIDFIDEQHQILVRVINDLYNHVVLHRDSGKSHHSHRPHSRRQEKQQQRYILGYLIGILVDYTHFHFGEEEQFMKESGLKNKWTKKHHKQHQEFVKKIENAHKRYLRHKTEESQLEIELLEFLKDWLQNHILNEDRHFCEWYLQQQHVQEQ